MYQDTLSLAYGLLYEFKNAIFLGLHCHISSLAMRENYLVFRIHPIEIEVTNTDTFPMIRYFFACTIYHMCHFVRNYEFQVLNTKLLESHLDYLCSEFISNKESVFDLDGANNIFLHHPSSTVSIHWRWKRIHNRLPIIIAVKILLHHIFIFNN